MKMLDGNHIWRRERGKTFLHLKKRCERRVLARHCIVVSKTSIQGENEWERMDEGEGGQVKDIGQSPDRRRGKLHPVTFNHQSAAWPDI